MVVLSRKPRSAEQTARLLLSNAFRYDTWECTAARNAVQSLGGMCTTVILKFHAVQQQGNLASSADEVNLSLFDPMKNIFVGAGYRCDMQRLNEAIVFQATPHQLLVVELLVRDTQPNAPLEHMRVTHWACSAVQNLTRSCRFSFRPGNAHLLLLEKDMWPPSSQSTAPESCTLGCTCELDNDSDLVKLMRELVPPGIFVPEAFTKATPQPGVKSFRLLISNIELVATTMDSREELIDPHTEWAVAAVAHNGYRQLGQGAEVSLVLQQRVPFEATLPSAGERTGRSTHTGALDGKACGTDCLPSSPAAESHFFKERSCKLNGAEAATTAIVCGANASNIPIVLRSHAPIEISGLPVHSTTSLVLALRNRRPENGVFKVIGFCVFPLCLMPMKNRDVRVENLPALRGPFSCEDARMLMVDASAPYGRVPIAVTLTIEYHEVEAPLRLHKAFTTPTVVTPSSPSLTEDEGVKKISEDKRMVPMSQVEGSRVPPVDKARRHSVQVSQGMKRPAISSCVTATVTQSSAPQQETPLLQKVAVVQSGQDNDIFQLLCTIVEELHKMRESQHHIFQKISGVERGDEIAVLPPALLEKRNQRLADGPIDLIDLTPRPMAISWAARRAIQKDLQPITHPLKGGILDESIPAVGELPTSLFGIRFEGITLDCSLAMPVNVCMLFSFGPLPYQRVGPMLCTSVEKNEVSESFKLCDGGRAGFVWCESAESLENVAIVKFKQHGGILHIHLYDALTMFYVATANLSLAHFVRSYRAAATVSPLDLTLERDFSLTERVVPQAIFPLMRNAGQLHVSLFCVGVASEDSNLKLAAMALVEEPSSGSRLIVAKRLPRTDCLNVSSAHQLKEGDTVDHNDVSTDDLSSLHGEQQEDATRGLHWKRVGYFKKQLVRDGTGTLLPGVPSAHVRAAQDAEVMEYRLRFAEKERDEAKSKAIARALLSRITVTHRVQVAAWRPEVIRTLLQNPHAIPLQFFVEVAPEDVDVCAPVDVKAAAFYLGPRERTEVPLVLRLNPPTTHTTGRHTNYGETRHIVAKVYTETRELSRWIDIYATLASPIVDRRYEIFGPAGSNITKSFFSRAFSSPMFSMASNQKELLRRMEQLCGFVATSQEGTDAKTSAVVDLVTQSYVTAWEDVSVTTAIPSELNQQRTEYVTLFRDAARTRVYETWELCVFACQSLTSREAYWGQTTVLGFPADGVEAMYCDESNIRVEHVGASFVLHFTPRETGSQRLLLHLLQQNILKKVLLTVPTVYPKPTFTQTIELSPADVTAPVFRRLTFTNHGDANEVFRVHHNYKYQLQLSPLIFGLAPGDSQYISLQFDMLSLPPGQLEGRWPMWIFINDANNKTVESYYLQVVLRAHPVTIVAPVH